MISSYLVAGFLGNSIPVVGIGIVSRLSTPAIADASLAATIAVLTLVALVTGAKFTTGTRPEDHMGFGRASHG